MAKTDIGPKISVEGEKEYRQQMQNIIARQKEYAAELKSTTASMDENTSAEQRASSVAAVLRKQIAAQTDALNAQKGMLLQATEKYGSASTQASAYRTAVYKTNAELETLKSRLRDAENGLGEFASKTDNATESVQNFENANQAGIFDGIASAVTKGNLVATALEKVGSAVVDAGKSAISTGVDYNSQMEQYTVAFTNMLGSADKAESALNQIKQDAAKTPFDTAGLVKANQYLISTGEDAKSARNIIMALGDAVKATGGGNDELSRMAQNLQQIKNAGKATSADIKQFAYAGIDVYGILADYTGKSTEDVQKMKISYDLLTNALLSASEEGGRYFGAMETQSQTLDGRISTLKDNATQLAGALTEGLASTEGELVNVATGWVQELTDSLQTGGVASMVETGGVLAGEAIDSFTDYAVNNMDGVLDTGLDIAENLASGVVQNAPKLLESAVTITGSFIGGLAEKFPDILASGAELTGQMVRGVLSLGQDMWNASKTLAAKAANGILTTNWLEVGWNISKGIVNGFINGMKTAEFSGMGGGKFGGGAGRQKKQNTEPETAVPKYDGSGGGGGSSGGNSRKKSSTKKAAQDTKKLAKSVTNTSKQLLQGTENIVGAISRTVETADNTYNVYDGTTKKLKGTTTQTVQTITDSWTEMVNGVETQFKRVQTLTDGVVTSEKVTSSIADEVAKKSVHTRAETLTAAQAEIDEAIGYVSRTAKTSTETKKVLNAETGALEDTVVSATKVVTDCYKRIVDGQEQTVERTTTYTNGIVTDVNEKVTDLNTSIKYTEGVLGGFSKFVLDLDTKLGGLEKVASNLTKSPLGQWFSDLAQGYRASDSFWDNIDVVGTLVGGLTGAAQGFQLTGSWAGGLVGGIFGIAGKLLGTSIDTEAGSWGADLVTGLAKGILGGGGIIAKAVSWIGDIIKGFLHFSRPDEGPLREYEKWMPDMIQGMADGIRDNAYLLQEAAADLGGKLRMQLQYDVGSANGFAQVATNSRTVSMGGINVNVYPSEGMDEERFAQYTITRLTQMINEEAAASGEVPVFQRA
nr:MAG TPA: tail tape measure protein [Caudoviricetes sp.]